MSSIVNQELIEPQFGNSFSNLKPSVEFRSEVTLKKPPPADCCLRDSSKERCHDSINCRSPPLSADGARSDSRAGRARDAKFSSSELPRHPGEADRDYARRLRRHNYLPLAQEFVDRRGSREAPVTDHSSAAAIESTKNLRNREKSTTRFVGGDDDDALLPVEPDSNKASSEKLKLEFHAEVVAACRGDAPLATGSVVADPPAISRQRSSSSEARSCVHRRRLPRDVVSAAAAASRNRASVPPPRCANQKSEPVPGSRTCHARRRSGHLSDDRRSGPDSDATLSLHDLGRFDVCNIETTMPTIDWSTVEEHLTRDQANLQKRRQNNREEIRRKLAMGSDHEDYYGGEPMSRKPNLQTRLQSGMNLQICFLNETVAEQIAVSRREKAHAPKELAPNPFSPAAPDAPSSGSAFSSERERHVSAVGDDNFVTRQAKLQAEARLALAQAKQMAHMQVQVEKRWKKKSPVAEMVGIRFPDGRQQLSRHSLSEMNVAQLQVIVNDIHTQIESLNGDLVRMLLERDDLHMEQDSMLVDVEDLTRYVGAKDVSVRDRHV